jgi:predicted TIM-barrel fold metal-dependent hydrolase
MMEDIGCEIDRIINLGLRGIKLHPDFQRFNVDAPEAYSIYDMVEDRLPILFHIGDDRYDYSHPRRLSKILGDFKHLRAIAAHLGGFKVWDEVKEYLIKPNVWFDTSSTLALLGKEAAKEHMRMLGIDRCFFGTDYPLWDYQREVQNFLTLGLKDDENRRILSGNIKAFLQICQ